MSADLRRSTGSGDASGSADQPRPADQPPPANQQPVPPVSDQAAGAGARRQKYAHLTEQPGQGRQDLPVRHPEGTATPQAADKPPAVGKGQDSAHANGADRTGAQPSPEVPQQRTPDPARLAEPGKRPDQAALTHIHWAYQGTNSDVYSDGTRSAYLSSPTEPHLGPSGSEGAEPAKGDPAALPAEVGKYLTTGDRQVGIPVVGEESGKAPCDTSDSPPSGEELVEGMDDDKLSRLERARRTAESQEILSDAPDAITAQGDAWQNALAKMPPEGHTVEVVHDHPSIANTTADHATVGDIASTGVMLGIVLFESGRWLANHLGHRKEG